MLPKKNRLKKKKDFDLVYKKGYCYVDSFLLIYVLDNEIEQRRCGFSISKKISKKAVKRNRLRRQICAVYRDSTVSSSKNADIIFVARKNVLDLTFLELKTVVERLLKKACFF